MTLDIVPSVCPHDCPSACSLEMELIDGRQIGRVRGASGQSRLIAAPSRSFLNTSFNNAPSSIAREGRPAALVHPEVLAGLGLGDGGRMRIGNRRGSVVVHARGFGGLQKRVVIVEALWPNHAFEEDIGINLLTSADPGLPRGGAVFHDTSVWLSPA